MKVHYNDVKLAQWRLKSPVPRFFAQPFAHAQMKKTSKFHVIPLSEGNTPATGGLPHKGPVMQKMFPFDDIIM